MDDSSSTSKGRCCSCSAGICRCVVAEFFCMFLFMFIVGTTDLTWADRAPVTELQVALTLGFAVTTLTQCFDAVSGSQLNPVVTLGLMVTRQVGLFKGLVLLLAHFLGAFTAVLLLQGSLPSTLQGTLGATAPSPVITSHLAFGIELVLTFIYVFVVLASWELRGAAKGARYGYGACCRALVLGLAYSMNTMWGYVFTQASMNPARSLAAAVITNRETTEWLVLLEVYVAGPVLGAVVSALIYKYIFAPSMVQAHSHADHDSMEDLAEAENMVALQSISSPMGRIKDQQDL